MIGSAHADSLQHLIERLDRLERDKHRLRLEIEALKKVSEATIHSAQFAFTGSLGSSITGHAEMLFDPEQSFGEGTNTDLERNQLQMRRAYVLFGDLDRSPFHAALGKMDVPFGLTDTVSPFTASTVWHAFGALANGVTVGYASDGLNVSVMAVQGGAQFRAANTPVDGTAVPSRLNNLAADVHYDFELGTTGSLLLGGSYIRGTAYCQDYPVQHFLPCRDNNPAFDVYGKLVHGNLTFKAELARTSSWSACTWRSDRPSREGAGPGSGGHESPESTVTRTRLNDSFLQSRVCSPTARESPGLSLPRRT